MNMNRKNLLQPIIGISLLIFWIIFVSVYLSSATDNNDQNTKNIANAFIGLGIGYVLQRSFFGFAGTVKRTWKGNPTLLYAVSLLFGLGAIIFSFLYSSNTAKFDARPIGLGVAIGALIFGLGMILANGCASGVLTDISQGSIATIIAFVFFVLGAVPGQMLQHTTNSGSLGIYDGYNLLDKWGYAPFLIATLVMLIGVSFFGFYISKKIRTKHGRDVQALQEAMNETPDIYSEWLKKNNYTDNNWLRLHFNVNVKKWSLYIGAIALMILLVLVFVVNGKGWGVTTSFAKWGGWIMGLEGKDVFVDTPNKAASMDKGILFDAGSFRNFGIILGALIFVFISNRLVIDTKEFKKRTTKEHVVRYSVAVIAGFMLGFGARIADGCNAGQLCNGIMTGSLSAWLFGIMMTFGGIAGVYIQQTITKRTNVSL